MKTPILLGILGALATGVAIGTQSTLNTPHRQHDRQFPHRRADELRRGVIAESSCWR